MDRTVRVIFICVLSLAPGAHAQYVQQAKLVGTGASGVASQGSAVSISADGNEVIVGGPTDGLLPGSTSVTPTPGAAWIFLRNAGVWSQQGNKLVGTGAVSPASQGSSVAMSGDGNTVIVGGPEENQLADYRAGGGAWVFARNNSGAWIQQGAKIGPPPDAFGPGQNMGFSAGLSGDGKTAIVGAPNDDYDVGAAWIFAPMQGQWVPQGSKLTGSDAQGTGGNDINEEQGGSVAISADGNTAIVGGDRDNGITGAAWIYVRNSDGTWSQQGGKLTARETTAFFQGSSVAISGDGNTAVVGDFGDSGNGTEVGATYIYTRSNGRWSEQARLVGTGYVGQPLEGSAVAISQDGKTVVTGGPGDSGGIGAAWVFTGAGSVWTQKGSKLVGGGILGTATNTALGTSVAVSADGSTIAIGGYGDNSGAGAAWVFGAAAGIATAPGSVNPASGSGSGQTMSFTFNDPRGWQDLDVVNVLINNFLDGRSACYLAYSRSAGVLYLVADNGGTLSQGLTPGGAGSVSNSQCTVAGAGSSASGNGNTLTLTLNLSFNAAFAGNKIVYLAARDLEGGNSGWQALGVWQVPSFATFPSAAGVNPARGAGSSATLTFTFNDTKGVQDLGVVNVLINNFLDGRQACYVAYSQPFQVLYLVGDAGGGLSAGVTLGGSGSVSNSQCTVSAAGSLASGSGTTLTLTLSISFTAAFDGNRVIYAAARDSAEANNSGWQAVGSWTVQ